MMGWADVYHPDLELRPGTMPVLLAVVEGRDRWQVRCPECGRPNVHTAGVGHRASHCRCPATVDGYVIAPPGSRLHPYPDYCTGCGMMEGFYTPVDLAPSEKGSGLTAFYQCDDGHLWTCYWGDSPFPSGPQLARPREDGPRVRCILYRHFDAMGVLLYVGISEDPEGRTRTHARTATWAQYASRMTADWYDTREEAERAERVAIVTEKPIFNIVHAIGDVEGRVRDYLRTGGF